MKFYVIAGEASGDLHGSNLMDAIRKRDESALFRCWGGDLMKARGGELVKHYRDLAFMGFSEVVMNIRTIIGNIKFCKKDILKYKPDALILVDYPGFNLRIAEFASNAGIKVFYYISPQIWAWKKSRVFKIKKFVNRLFVILPFEKDFYARYDCEVDFIGHPLMDMIARLPSNDHGSFRKAHDLSEKPLIALLPGSRKQEIRKMLPVMLTVVPEFSDYQFVVAGAPSVEPGFYDNLTGNTGVRVITGATHALLQNSFAALVTSGTATLETALFNVPEVVCYKGSFISYQIARRVIDQSFIRFISLVNLIMDKEVVKELIQHELTTTNLIRDLQRITGDKMVRERMHKDYGHLKEKLGGPGASENTARLIFDYLNKTEV